MAVDKYGAQKDQPYFQGWGVAGYYAYVVFVGSERLVEVGTWEIGGTIFCECVTNSNK